MLAHRTVLSVLSLLAIPDSSLRKLDVVNGKRYLIGIERTKRPRHTDLKKAGAGGSIPSAFPQKQIRGLGLARTCPLGYLGKDFLRIACRNNPTHRRPVDNASIPIAGMLFNCPVRRDALDSLTRSRQSLDSRSRFQCGCEQVSDPLRDRVQRVL